MAAVLLAVGLGLPMIYLGSFLGQVNRQAKANRLTPPRLVYTVTLDASGIKNIKDLKGKRVAVGAAGSGAEANARQILEAYGITYNDIEVQYLSFAEGASALKDGNVDAALPLCFAVM